MPRRTFQDCRCQRPIPVVSPCWSNLPRRPSNTRRWFGSVSCGVIAPFLWVLVHTKFFLYPPRLEFLFPPVLWKSCNQIPLTLRIRFPRDSQSLCQIPSLGSLIWGSEPSQQWEDFFGIIILQFVRHAPGGYGIWSYSDCTPPTISLRLRLCLWMWRISFWWVPATSYLWLFNSYLRFWRSHMRRWAHVHLLHHLEPEVF